MLYEWCHVISYHVIWCHAMLFHITSCYVISHYVVSFDVSSCDITEIGEASETGRLWGDFLLHVGESMLTAERRRRHPYYVEHMVSRSFVFLFEWRQNSVCLLDRILHFVEKILQRLSIRQHLDIPKYAAINHLGNPLGGESQWQESYNSRTCIAQNAMSAMIESLTHFQGDEK